MRQVNLSDRQLGMLRAIHDHIEENGIAPSIRELTDALGISSTSVVVYNLDQLQIKGMIRRDRILARAILLTHEGRAFLRPHMNEANRRALAMQRARLHDSEAIRERLRNLRTDPDDLEFDVWLDALEIRAAVVEAVSA